MYGYGNSMFLATHGILARGNAGTPPVNTVAPVISGSTSVGSTLTTTNGTWTGTPVISYTYQWYRGVSQIVGATNSTYVLVAADVSNSIKCRVTATNAFGSANADSNSITATLDPDAQAFITAASITDPTQQSAINQLVVDLKGYNIWTKMKALYPFVGGTASTHKWNLKDPRDLDAAFRLVFNGGWTFSSNGALPNGTNAFADTFLIPSTVLSLNSTHISCYTRTNTTVFAPLLSSENAVNYNNGLFIWPKYSGNLFSVRINDNSSDAATAVTNTQGLHLATRTAANVKKYRHNNTQVLSNTTVSASLNTSSIYIGASRNNANYSTHQTAFASIGDGLTDTEAANFYTAIQAFQTTLGRQV